MSFQPSDDIIKIIICHLSLFWFGPIEPREYPARIYIITLLHNLLVNYLLLVVMLAETMTQLCSYHFIKIPFIYKGIEFIDLHSIFKDNSVISSIPNYFNYTETPIICYKYNKPIRSTIFNFKKIVNDLDIDSNTPAS